MTGTHSDGASLDFLAMRAARPGEQAGNSEGSHLLELRGTRRGPTVGDPGE